MPNTIKVTISTKTLESEQIHQKMIEMASKLQDKELFRQSILLISIINNITKIKCSFHMAMASAHKEAEVL
tara:strand:- start:17 stop:229 length:213 start_codon:yes stop_codon:yes gene_type:complete